MDIEYLPAVPDLKGNRIVGVVAPGAVDGKGLHAAKVAAVFPGRRFGDVFRLRQGNAVAAGGMTEIIIKMTNSIYMGFEAILYTENVIMRTPPYYFFLTLLPLFVVGTTAYYLGASEISIMKKLGFQTKHKPTGGRKNK